MDVGFTSILYREAITIQVTGGECGIRWHVALRRITIEVPEEVLEKAQQASGGGVTQTVRAGLQLLAASRTYQRLRQMRGVVGFSKTPAQLRADR